MVLLSILAGLYFGLAVTSALRAILAHGGQDAPVLQLFFAFTWGLLWPVRVPGSLTRKGQNHVG